MRGVGLEEQGERSRVRGAGRRVTGRSRVSADQAPVGLSGLEGKDSTKTEVTTELNIITLTQSRLLLKHAIDL